MITRSIRPRAIAAAALAAIVLVYFLLNSLSPTSSWRHHALSSTEDPGLDPPNDPVPRRDFAALSKFEPQNIHEPNKFAFATLYCSRNPDPRGPYFESTQSIIWRLLWSEYRSKFPVIVYVCPFIPEANRRVFRGQGALVKEIELLDDIIPDEVISTKRWIDVLSKLNLWKEVDWRRLVFLDSDAFPVRNIDDIFDLVPEQHCKRDSLSTEDAATINDGKGGEEMCNYVYAGVAQFTLENINAGMLVLKPNLDMHAKLLRAARLTSEYDVKDMEQGVLRSQNAFSAEGPFPVKRLSPVWNALPEYYISYLADETKRREEDGEIRVLHAKMWNRFWGSWNNLTQLNDMWDLDWMRMCRFYDSEDFAEARRTGKYETPTERFLREQASKNDEG